MAMSADAEIAALAELDGRDVKALTRTMTACSTEPDLLDGQVAVYSSHYDATEGKWVTNRYVVDPDAGVCGCPDMLHRRPDGGCHHLRRVWFRRGDLTIPRGVDRTALADDLREVRD